MFFSSSIVASRIFALFVVKSTRLGGVAGVEPILAMPGFWELFVRQPLPNLQKSKGKSHIYIFLVLHIDMPHFSNHFFTSIWPLMLFLRLCEEEGDRVNTGGMKGGSASWGRVVHLGCSWRLVHLGGSWGVVHCPTCTWKILIHGKINVQKSKWFYWNLNCPAAHF